MAELLRWWKYSEGAGGLLRFDRNDGGDYGGSDDDYGVDVCGNGSNNV